MEIIKKLIILISLIIMSSLLVFATGTLPDGYRITNDDQAGAITKYYGYTKKASDWWIVMRTSTTSSATQYQYAIGADSYSIEWSTRAYLSYYDWSETWANPN